MRYGVAFPECCADSVYCWTLYHIVPCARPEITHTVFFTNHSLQFEESKSTRDDSIPRPSVGPIYHSHMSADRSNHYPIIGQNGIDVGPFRRSMCLLKCRQHDFPIPLFSRTLREAATETGKCCVKKRNREMTNHKGCKFQRQLFHAVQGFDGCSGKPEQ